VFGPDGKQIGTTETITAGQAAITGPQFQSYHDSTTNASGTGYVSGATTVGSNGTADVTVVVLANFAQSATTGMKASDALGEINATLAQVRA